MKQKNKLNTSTPIYKYMRSIFVILLFFLSAIFQLIPILLFKIDINNINFKEKVYLSVFSNIMFLMVLVFLYNKELKQHFINLQKSKKKKLMITLDTSFRYWLIGLLIMVISNLIISKFGIELSTNDTSIRNMLDTAPIIASLSTVLISPFIEEIVFRTAFRDLFKNKWCFIIISGLVFGGLHIFSSLNNGYELLYLIPYCSMGLALSIIYEYGDNIYINYIFHLLHNALALLIAFLSMGVIL